MSVKCFMILASYGAFSFNCRLTGPHEISLLESEKSRVMVQGLGELASNQKKKNLLSSHLVPQISYFKSLWLQIIKVHCLSKLELLVLQVLEKDSLQMTIF